MSVYIESDSLYAKLLHPKQSNTALHSGSKYIRKEKLWPYLDEYVDNLIAYFRKQKKIPTLIHGHYADGGYVATEIAYYFHIPLVFTGHSLGRNKAEYLTKTGISKERLEQYYNMSTRIGHEERTLRNADLVITSTDYERKELYRSYENHLIEKFQVIPPDSMSQPGK